MTTNSDPPLSRVDRPLGSLESSASTGTCEPHTLCSSCHKAFNGPTDLEWPLLDCTDNDNCFMLHSPLLALKASVNELCHFCTLVWENIARETSLSSDLWAAILQDPDTPVFLRHSVGHWPCWFEVICSMVERSLYSLPIITIAQLDHERNSTLIFVSLYDNTRLHPAHCYINTSSSEHVRMIKYWIEKCNSTHEACRKSSGFILPGLLFFQKMLLKSTFASLTTRRILALT
jgi:hypothetical protein